MGQMDIKSLLNAKQDILKSKLDILFSHPVTKGDHCESAWIDFFRSFLPSRYAVDKGFVFDAKGNVSEQIDIIIYDALYAPLVFGTESGEKFVTAESVYAVFDSKSKINKETLEYTNNKIESVLKLNRGRRGVINGGEYKPPRELSRIYGGILAIDSIGEKSLQQHLTDFKNIDFGCAIKKNAFFTQRNQEREFENLIIQEDKDIVLAFFYLILNELYKLGTVAGLDIREYAKSTLDILAYDKEKQVVV